MEHLAYEHRLSIGADQPGEEKAVGRPYHYSGKMGRDSSDRMRGNGFKLKEGRFRSVIRKKFFTVGMVRHWNRLPREAADASSLEVFNLASYCDAVEVRECFEDWLCLLYLYFRISRACADEFYLCSGFF